MSDPVNNQAAGLRRLLARDFVRSLTFVGGSDGIGRSSVLTSVGAALARLGRQVLILDENAGRGSAAQLLGLRPSLDLLDVMEGRATMDAAMMSSSARVRLLRAAKAFHLLSGLPQSVEHGLSVALNGLRPKADYVLVDAPAGDAVQTPSLSLASQEVIVVISPQRESISLAYTLLKRLSWDFARRRFHVLASRVRSGAQGEALFENLQRAARRFLNLDLVLLGAVPEDEALRRAQRADKTVVEAFTDSPSALASRLLADTINQWPYPSEDCLDNFVRRLIQRKRGSPVSENG